MTRRRRSPTRGNHSRVTGTLLFLAPSTRARPLASSTEGSVVTWRAMSLPARMATFSQRPCSSMRAAYQCQNSVVVSSFVWALGEVLHTEGVPQLDAWEDAEKVITADLARDLSGRATEGLCPNCADLEAISDGLRERLHVPGIFGRRCHRYWPAGDGLLVGDGRRSKPNYLITFRAAPNCCSSSAMRACSGARTGSSSATVKRGVICCGQFQSNASIATTMRRSSLAP